MAAGPLQPFSPAENYWSEDRLHNEQVQAEEDDFARKKIPDLCDYINNDETTFEDAFSMTTKPDKEEGCYGTPEVDQQVQESQQDFVVPEKVFQFTIEPVQKPIQEQPVQQPQQSTLQLAQLQQLNVQSQSQHGFQQQAQPQQLNVQQVQSLPWSQPVVQDDGNNPLPIELSLSARDFTGGPAHQWNKYSNQHELQVNREMNLNLGGGVVGTGKGDYVELRMVHAGTGFGNLYKVTPVAGQADKDLSVVEAVERSSSFGRDADGAVFARVDNFKGKSIGFKVNTLSTSEHNQGRKALARLWQLCVTGQAGGRAFSGELKVQSFGTLRPIERLRRATKRSRRDEQQEEGDVVVQEVAVAPISEPPQGKKRKLVKKEPVEMSKREQLEASFLELQRAYLACLPDAALEFKVQEMRLVVENSKK